MMLHVAIPALDELEFLPHTIQALAEQETNFPFQVYVCVNQPNEWWNDNQKIEICKNNEKLLRFLNNFKSLNIKVIDKTSLGNGWKANKCGVGWARKSLFDEILKIASDEDIMVSLDADTLFNKSYIQSIGENFAQHEMNVLSLPYYHKLTEDKTANLAILRYEIYMRNYFINMYRISSPYTFTAIGSAIAIKIKALRKIRGITPLNSGEDFYLLQKLRKMSPISNYNAEMVYPAARFSTRVDFGTGPAIIKGSQGDWTSYPIYHHSLFNKIKETYDIIPELFIHDVETEFTAFLKLQYKTNDLWGPLRKNFKSLPQFTRAFHEKADGLRILQFLKSLHKDNKIDEARTLNENLEVFQRKVENVKADLSWLRDKLFEIEMEIRNKNFS